MVNFFDYLLNASICITTFYSFYFIFLRKVTLFNANRIYLIFSLLLVLIIPLLNIKQLLFAERSIELILNDISLENYLSNDFSETVPVENRFNISQLFPFVYVTGIALILSKIFINVFKIAKLVHKNQIIRIDNQTFVILDKGSMPFSFFHFIFIDKNKLYDPSSLSIIEHEKVHARELHSLDLIIAELICALLWFNPFVYFFRNSIKANHEYLADSKVIRSGFNPLDYLVTLAKEVFKKHFIKLTSNFNYSLTKKRLIMLTKINSKKNAGLRFFLILPLLAILILTCSKPIQEKPILSADTILLIERKQTANIPSIMPIDKKIAKSASGYGWRVHPIYKIKKFHNAIDFKAPEGTKVYATASGIAEIVECHKNSAGHLIGEGKYIRLRHDKNFQTQYTHLSGFAIKQGDKVSLGQVIGYVGNTGFSTAPHLHYEVIKDGKNINPINFIGKIK